MSGLEMLFALELEYQRRLRTEAVGAGDSSSLHTSYALQSGYEPVIRGLGAVTREEVERLTHRYTLTDDVRDVFAARDSIVRLLGLEILR